MSESGVLLAEQYSRNGKPHREDGPAIVGRAENGRLTSEEYYLDGERHRLDGPALIEYDGMDGDFDDEEYYVHGEYFSADKFARLREALDGGAPLEWALSYAEGSAR